MYILKIKYTIYNVGELSFYTVAYQLLNSLCVERDTSQYEDVGLFDIFVILAPECWESSTFENHKN